MHGVFNLKLMDDGGIPDAVWREAVRARDVRSLLRGRRTLREVRTKNLVFDNFAAFVFRWRMSGGTIDLPYEQSFGPSAWMASINLMDLQTDPSYEDASSQTVSIDTVTGAIAGGGKRFIEDDAHDPTIVVDPTGREAVIVTSTFLYAPSEAVSNAIYSIGTHFAATPDITGATQRGIASRALLVDSQGRNIQLVKTDRQILLVEYVFMLAAI